MKQVLKLVERDRPTRSSEQNIIQKLAQMGNLRMEQGAMATEDAPGVDEERQQGHNPDTAPNGPRGVK